MTTASTTAQPGIQPANARLWRLLDGDLPVAIALLILVVVLWLPFGFAVPFWADGWPSTATADNGVVILNDVRPLVYAPWAVARLLSPNLFVNVNLLIAGSIFGKAFLLYLILKRLFAGKPLAFAAAALLVVFPVDTAIFNEGTLSIHVALFAYLGAVYALLAYWQHPRWYWLMLVQLALLVTTGIYETVYPLILFTPLILLYPQPKITRRFVGVSLLWYAVPLLVAARFALLLTRQDDSYQSGLFTGIDPTTALGSVLRVYGRHAGAVWESFWGMLHPRYRFVSGGVAFVGLLWLSRRAVIPPKRQLLIFVVAGLAILGLGYAPYLPTALRDGTDRTYFYSSVGAVVGVSAAALLLLGLLPARRAAYALFALLIAILVGRATVVSLDRHQVNVNNGMAQVPVLRAITSQVNALAPDALLLVIDESETRVLRVTFTQTSFYFARALEVLYEDPLLQAAICYPDDQAGWGHFRETCQLTPDEVILNETKMGTRTFTYDQIVALTYQDDGMLTLLDSLAAYVPDALDYAPNRLILHDVPPPPRAAILLPELRENSP